MSDLTVEQLQALIVDSVAEAGTKTGASDPIPHGRSGHRLPWRIYDAQDAGQRVATDLLTAKEYGQLLTGHTSLPDGSQAELDYRGGTNYGSTLNRLNFVRAHISRISFKDPK